MLPPWWLLAAIRRRSFAFGCVAAARAGRDPDACPSALRAGFAGPAVPAVASRSSSRVLRAAAGPARDLFWLVVFWLIAYRASAACGSANGDRALPDRHLRGERDRLRHGRLAADGHAASFRVATSRTTWSSRRACCTMAICGSKTTISGRSIARTSIEPLRPDYLTRGVDGQIYSVHPVGLPVLAMPAFALGGYRGVVAMLVADGRACRDLLWQWAREITGSTPGGHVRMGGCGSDRSLPFQLLHGVSRKFRPRWP